MSRNYVHCLRAEYNVLLFFLITLQNTSGTVFRLIIIQKEENYDVDVGAKLYQAMRIDT